VQVVVRKEIGHFLDLLRITRSLVLFLRKNGFQTQDLVKPIRGNPLQVGDTAQSIRPVRHFKTYHGAIEM
jgi:hypothetical protein